MERMTGCLDRASTAVFSAFLVLSFCVANTAAASAEQHYAYNASCPERWQAEEFAFAEETHGRSMLAQPPRNYISNGALVKGSAVCDGQPGYAYNCLARSPNPPSRGCYRMSNCGKIPSLPSN